SPPPSAWAPSFDGEWWLLEPSQQLYWFAEADDARMIPPRRRSIGLNSAEASKPLLISRIHSPPPNTLRTSVPPHTTTLQLRFPSKRRASEICRDTAHRYSLQPRSFMRPVEPGAGSAAGRCPGPARHASGSRRI